MAVSLRLMLVLWLTLLGGAAHAQTFPKFTGLVVDAANILPPEAEAELQRKLEALQKETHRQLVVATVPDLQGYPIEDYGYRLGRSWAVGLRDVNNGLVLLVAPTERKVRIEVGYGLEPIVTDALSGRIIRNDITPRFKAGDFPGGINAGVDALATQLRASPEEAKARADAAIAEFDKEHRRSTSSGGSGGGVPVGLIFWGVILLFFIVPMFARGRRGRRYRGSGIGSGLGNVVLWGIANEIGRSSRGSGWGSSSSSSGGFGGSSGGSDGSWGGGGFTGGGGGSFGGGGASGDW